QEAMHDATEWRPPEAEPVVWVRLRQSLIRLCAAIGGWGDAAPEEAEMMLRGQGSEPGELRPGTFAHVVLRADAGLGPAARAAWPSCLRPAAVDHEELGAAQGARTHHLQDAPGA